MVSSRTHVLVIFLSTESLPGHRMAAAAPDITFRPDSAQDRKQYLPISLLASWTPPSDFPSSHGSQLVHVVNLVKEIESQWLPEPELETKRGAVNGKRGHDLWGGSAPAHKLCPQSLLSCPLVPSPPPPFLSVSSLSYEQRSSHCPQRLWDPTK